MDRSDGERKEGRTQDELQGGESQEKEHFVRGPKWGLCSGNAIGQEMP